MKNISIVGIVSLLLIITISNIDKITSQGLRPDEVNERVQSVFGVNNGQQPPSTPTQNTPRPQSSRGFDQIVTPEPIFDPTISPQIFTATNGKKCTCVEYHLCDPITNTQIRNTEINNEDTTFDGFGVIDIRFDADSCQDVLDVCCADENRKEQSIQPPPIATKPNRAAGCGIRNVGGIDFKITGDTNNEAGFGEFPWVVVLIRISDDAEVCVGSLIHPKAVLTGNHCVLEFLNDARNLKIRAGEWDTQTKKERLPYQERITSRIFSHPNYNARSLAYNFAIIELEDPFELNDNIATACLPPDNYVSNSQHCFASGWGKDVFGKAGKYSVIMKKVPLPLVPFNDCQSALQTTRLTKKFKLDSSFICAGGVEGIDTCEGDGGAPLVCPVGPPQQNRYVQVGIVSWGIGCKQNIPAVYAKVSAARSWVDGQIRYIGLDPNYYSY